jgi:spermidine synthase
LAVENCYGRHYIYQQLVKDGVVIDTNDPGELRKHRGFLMMAHGSVAVSGVGLGAFLYRLLKKENVWHVTVAEPDAALIRILRDAFSEYSERLTFVHCKPESLVNIHVYDCVYHNK